MAQATLRVIRCFCGCSELTMEEIETITMSTISAFVQNAQAKQLFRNFMKIGRLPDDIPEVIKYLECYEYCEELSQLPPEECSNYENIDALLERCPNYAWEERVNESISANNKEQLQSTLDHLMEQLKLRIERDRDYHKFKRKLLDKLRPVK